MKFMSFEMSSESFLKQILTRILFHWKFVSYVFFKILLNSSFIFNRIFFSSKWTFNISFIWWNHTFRSERCFNCLTCAKSFFTSFRFFNTTVFLFFLFEKRFSTFRSEFVLKRNKISKITWNFSNLILILMSNADKNWNVRTKRKFSLFVLNVVKKICLIRLAIIA